MRGRGLWTAQDLDHASAEPRLPVREGGITFLGRKPPAMNAFKLAGRNTVITRMHVPQTYTAYNVPDPDWITLHIPLSWDGDYFLTGGRSA